MPTTQDRLKVQVPPGIRSAREEILHYLRELDTELARHVRAVYEDLKSLEDRVAELEAQVNQE